MEEASLAFSVEDAAEVSDEEDDHQRKAELHQLLTEQLQDDLLDESVSTVTTEEGMADSTLLGDEMGVSFDHVISPNQSRDFASLLNASSNEGLLVADDRDSGQHNLKLGPASSEQVAPSAAQPPPPSQPTPVAGCGLTEVSDVFSGTAQAYSLLQPTADDHPCPVNCEPSPEAGSFPGDPLTSGPPGVDEHPGVGGPLEPRGHGPAHPHTSGPPSHPRMGALLEPRGHGQLEVLYGARCRQVEVLNQQLQEAREEGEVQARLLQHEKSQLESQLCEAQDIQKDLKHQIQSLTEQLHDLNSANRAAKAEQEQICAMLHPPPKGGSGDLAGRLVELSTQKEDLQYQLSCCQGQLETHIQRAESAEVKVSSLTEELSLVRSEVMELREEVVRLREEGERERETREQDKREALEKCRVACLQLHEDATERLKEAMTVEKQSLLESHQHQMTSLQRQLSAVQEEYVRLCGEKDKLEAGQVKKMEQVELELQLRADQLVESALEKERERAEREREREREERETEKEKEREKGTREEVRVAVERAREEWRQALAEESRNSVELALSTARQQWQARMAAEVEEVRAEERQGKDAAISAAVAAAREQWQLAQQKAVQVAVEETRKQCSHSMSETVLTATQVHSMLQATMAAVKNDVRHALQEVVRIGEERERQAAARSRLATAEEMKSHYLNCLHMMVNTGVGVHQGNTRPSNGSGQLTSSGVGGDRGGVTMATSVSSRAQRVGINKSATTSKKLPVKGSAPRIGSGSGLQKGSGGVLVRQAKSSTATSRQGHRLRHQT